MKTGKTWSISEGAGTQFEARAREPMTPRDPGGPGLGRPWPSARPAGGGGDACAACVSDGGEKMAEAE